MVNHRQYSLEKDLLKVSKNLTVFSIRCKNKNFVKLALKWARDSEDLILIWLVSRKKKSFE